MATTHRGKPTARTTLKDNLLQRPGYLVISGAFLASGGVAIYLGGLWVTLIVHFGYLIALLVMNGTINIPIKK